MRASLLGLALTGIVFLIAACGGSGAPVLRVGGIPDQDASRLARRYDGFAKYLSQRLGVEVRYVPSSDYAAVVTAFQQGNLDLAFFGGFTGVQARLLDPGAKPLPSASTTRRFAPSSSCAPMWRLVRWSNWRVWRAV